MADYVDHSASERRGALDRRKFLTAAAQATALLALPELSGCLGPRPAKHVLPSDRPPFSAFRTVLPLLSRLRAHTAADGTSRLALSAQPGLLPILAGSPTRVRAYDGVFPGPVIEVESGRPLLLLLTNRLSEPIVHHLHGGRTPSSSDGFPMDFIPSLPAGVNPPDINGVQPGQKGTGWQAFDYPNGQRAAMLWYHDHRMDHTGNQVWHGLLGTYIVRDDEERSLGLPSGEKELVLVIADRSFDAQGQFKYPVTADGMLDDRYMGGVLGDVILVNGAPWPSHPVARGMYRLRILNASNARDYTLALDRTMPVGYQFVQIGSDGGLLQKPIPRSRIHLAPAERVDLLIDFTGCVAGTPVRLLNVGESGPLGQVMQFVPAQEVGKTMKIPQKLSTLDLPNTTAQMVERTFDFKYSRIKKIWTVNGQGYDPNRIDARPRLNSTEIWHLRTDFTHPLHLHLVHFRVLQHDGKPSAADMGWKDTVSMVAGETSTIIIPFTGFTGRYVFHCHNLEHEDMRMMANFEVVA
jgi:spore coat protein A